MENVGISLENYSGYNNTSVSFVSEFEESFLLLLPPGNGSNELSKKYRLS